VRFGQKSAALAILSGEIASGLQALVLLVLTFKVSRPDFNVGGFFSMLLLLGLAAGAFSGFRLLQRSPELGYFMLSVGAGVFLFAAGFIAVFTVGAFVLPGAVAILLAALLFLMAGEDPLPLWRRVFVIMLDLAWLAFFIAQLYSAGYLLNLPWLR